MAIKGIKETKAERIFRHNFFATINHIDNLGMDSIDAWNRLEDSEDERVCRRTVNAILALCDRKDRVIDFHEKHGKDMTLAPANIQRKAVSVIRNTCNNWIKREEEWKAHLTA